MAAATILSPFGAAQFQGLFDVIVGEATVDSGSLADAAGATSQITGVTGAAIGDMVLVSVAVDIDDMLVDARVTAAGVIDVRFQNESGSAADSGAVTAKFIVLSPKW